MLRGAMLLFFFVSLLILFPKWSAAKRFKIAFSTATLLSGDLATCETPTDSACRRGAAGAAQVLRELREAGDNVTYIPNMDRQTAFVQMHPESWGVNRRFFEYFGWNAYATPPSLFTERDRPGWELLREHSGPLPLLSNVRVDADDRFFGFVRRTFIENGVGFILCSSDTQPNSLDCVATIRVAVPYLRRQPLVDALVVLTSESDGDRALAPFAARLAELNAAPDLILTTRFDAPVAATYNQTVGIGDDASASVLSVFTVDFDLSTKRVLGVTRERLSLNIVGPQRTPQFYADIEWTMSEARRASANDPVLGYSTFMPLTREGSIRMCMGGECPLASLFTNIMRWAFTTDVSFTNAGGVRGPGWPAGPVRVSDIWGALPFANTVCHGTMTGLRIWRLINTSYGLATFSTENHPMGGTLLHSAGMRIRYSKHLAAFRVISIDVLDRSSGAFKPLERTRLYRFAAESFVCESFTPFSDIFTFPARSPALRGEIPYSFSSNTLQDIAGDFFAATTSADAPYNTTLDGRMVCLDCGVDIEDEAALAESIQRWGPQSMRWEQSLETCPVDTRWEGDIATCVPCGPGEHQPVAGSTSCVPIPSDSGTPLAVLVIIPIVCLLAVGAIAWGVFSEVQKRKNARNTANAPKEGNVTLMFTDIQASTKLWSTCPQSMSTALDIHHSTIRECIARHRAYEVKTVGDSFMVAVSSAAAGVALARDIQLELMSRPFPAAIDQVYAAETDEDLDAIVDDEAMVAPLGGLWNGTRVRIGLHTGCPEVVFDDVVKGYDYYGPCTNLAARVESVAAGGQICITRAVEAALSEKDKTGLVIEPLAAVELRGVHGKTEILQVTPVELRGRVFSKFEDDNDADADDNAEAASSHGSTASFMNNEHTVMCSKVIRTLLRAIRPKEKKQVVDSVSKAWRVQRSKSEDDAIEQVSRRISLIVKKEMEKADVMMVMEASHLKGSVNSTTGNQAKRPSIAERRRSAANSEDAPVSLSIPGAVETER